MQSFARTIFLGMLPLLLPLCVTTMTSLQVVTWYTLRNVTHYTSVARTETVDGIILTAAGVHSNSAVPRDTLSLMVTIAFH